MVKNSFSNKDRGGRLGRGRLLLTVLCIGIPLLVLAFAGPKRPGVTFSDAELAGEPVPVAELGPSRQVVPLGGDSVAIESGLPDGESGTVRSSLRGQLPGTVATAPAPMPRLIVPSLDRDRSSFGLDSLGEAPDASALGSGDLQSPSWGWLADDYFSDSAPRTPATEAPDVWGMSDRDPRSRMDPMQRADPFQQPGLSPRSNERSWMDR